MSSPCVYIITGCASGINKQEGEEFMDIEALKNVIEEVCRIDTEDIDEDTRLSDAGMDSLDLAQVVFAVESELEIEIDPDILEEIVTVGDALEAIQEAQRS